MTEKQAHCEPQRQMTLATTASLEGIGLHTGHRVKIVFRPGQPNTGIVFALNGAFIPASPRAVAETHLGTRLQNSDGVTVQTVEHLMAAVAFAGVDNLIVEMDACEPPAVDGSAAPFLDVLERAGLVELPAPRHHLKVTKPIEVRDGDRFIVAMPDDCQIVKTSIEFDDSVIGCQQIEIDVTDQFLIRRRLATARTFCRLKDIEMMRQAGYSRGGSLDNALVVDGDRLMNASGLRDPQEFVLHKALDLIGDLRLLGAPVIGKIVAHKCGHDLNTRFARHLLDHPECFEWAHLPRAETRSLEKTA
ncbi:MAG: UDP-3-O-acyl-N-acetylglucosamine deacetylase [Pseudomonadota bacterium]